MYLCPEMQQIGFLNASNKSEILGGQWSCLWILTRRLQLRGSQIILSCSYTVALFTCRYMLVHSISLPVDLCTDSAEPNNAVIEHYTCISLSSHYCIVEIMHSRDKGCQRSNNALTCYLRHVKANPLAWRDLHLQFSFYYKKRLDAAGVNE